jgi:hypothetical protein
MSEETKAQMDEHMGGSEEMRGSMDHGMSKPMGGDVEKPMETRERDMDDSRTTDEDMRKPVGGDMDDSMEMP